jgi:isoleucyl-tRNA synthetase
VASAEHLSVALDTTTDASLEAEGLAREVVSRIQQIRREIGLAVIDRVRVRWSTDDPTMAVAIENHADYIASEVLAVNLDRTPFSESESSQDLEGIRLGLEVEKADV